MSGTNITALEVGASAYDTTSHKFICYDGGPLEGVAYINDADITFDSDVVTEL